MRHKRILFARFVILTLLMLLPVLALAGGTGPAGTARAGTPLEAPRDEVLVLRVYFNSTEERDYLASEFGAEEYHTLDGYLTYWGDRDLYETFKARGLRVEIDAANTEAANRTFESNDPGTFFGGYRTVEEMEAFLDAKVAAYPTLAQKIDIGDSWCKTHPGACTLPTPTWNGYDLWVLRISNQATSEATAMTPSMRYTERRSVTRSSIML